MKNVVLFCLMLLVCVAGRSQEVGAAKHMFKVFYYDKNDVRTDIPENEHVSTKLSGGILVHKAKIVLLGDTAKINLSNHKDLYVEIVDTIQLKPEYFHILKLKVKKGNREATRWSNSPVGVKDSSDDFIPTMLYPADRNSYRVDIKDLPSGHYLVLYQEGLNTLLEVYDFDK